MSQLLMSWINDEVQLSKRITNFEEDFHNGYLFGELLSKYSQQLNFNEFIDKDDKASRISNFSLLYDTFKTLKVSFDSNIAMNIIQKKIGVAKKVLYQLKMQLQKTTSNSFTKLTKSAKPLSPLKKIPVPKQKFDKISKQHFSKQLNELHQAQKALNLQYHLSKFPDFHQKQLQKAQQQQKKDAQTRLLGQIKFRQKQIDNIKKSSQFRNDWEQTNIQKWANNMAVRKLQQQKDNNFKSTLNNTKLQNKTLSELTAIKSLDKDLKQFEKKAGKKKDDSDSSSEENNKNQIQQQPILLKKISSNKTNNNFGLNKTSNFQNRSKLMATGQIQDQLKRKKNPEQVELARHQRQKRRRKMIVQQSKKHQLIKIDRRQKYIINTLQQNSKQEKQIQYEIWRAWQNKQIIIQNKKNYNEKAKQKEQVRAMNAKFKDDQLTKTFRQEHQKQLKQGVQRQNKLKTHNSVKKRKSVYDQCKNIIQCVIQMTQVIYDYDQQINKEELNETFLTHLFDEFVQSTKSKKQIAQLELSNYIHGKGEWKIQIKRQNEQKQKSVEPTEQNSLPNTMVNNYYVGNILKTVFSQLYKDDAKQVRKQMQGIENLISILGLQFSGKKIAAQYIKQKFGFNIITIPELVQQKLKQIQMMKSKGLQIEKQSADFAQICYSGKKLQTDIITNLIKQKVQKNSKSILINYPITYQECVALTNTFGGIEPSDYSTKSKLASKIAQFSRLVWPSETKIIQRKLRNCGIDLALWIQISPKASIDRFLGRRWTIDGEVVQITDQVSDPNILRTGEKASGLILKNSFKLKNKEQVKDWLNQFGIFVKQNQQQFIQKCWDQIQGECSPEQLIQKVVQTIQKSLDIKQKHKKQLKLMELASQQQSKKQLENEKFEQSLKQKCVLSTAEHIKQKYKKAIASVKMDRLFLQNIQKIWSITQKSTINGFLSIFQSFRDQEQAKNKYISDTKSNFIRILTREDQRFYLVKKFQNQYNKFFDESNDMVVQNFTKQQLHQRIQDLEVDLLTLIQEKKQDAICERQNIMKSGWLQSQLDQIMSNIHILLQIELNRSFACQQIISDFYSKKYSVNSGEIQETPTQLPIDNQLQIIKQNSFPRLQKLVSEAMRIFNKQEQVVDDKNKKGGKAPPKKDDKKQAKKGGKQQSEEKVELTLQQKQMKKAINTEKAIFRYRLKVVLAFATKKLKQFQQAGLRMYSDLQDLYKYTDKVENRTIIQMTKIFKNCIQQQSKIQNQVYINYIDVIQSELIRNFKKPMPIIEPAAEKTLNNRFTISNINQLISLFLNQSESGVKIKNNRLLILFQQLSINQRFKSMLPQNWKKLTKQQHQHFISKFDKQGNGEIQLWIIFLSIALSDCRLPSQQQIKQYQLLVTDHNPLTKQIEFNKIQKTKAWFDSQEPTEQNVRFFDRNKCLKSILCKVFRKQDGSQKVVLEKYLKRLSLSSYRNIKINNTPTYFQFVFSQH